MKNHEIDSSEITISDVIFVIVLFKTIISDSTTFNTLKTCVNVHNLRNVDLLVYDNSPVDDSIKKVPIFDEFDITYIPNDKNYGVSHCYNQAAVLASKFGKKYMILLDQDTLVPPNLISIYIDSLNKWKGFPIYVPKLISNNVLFSPCNYKFYKASHIRDNFSSGVYKMKGKNVLNSGLAISISSFKKVGGYEESVRLYFSDFVFFNKMKIFYEYFIIMDCALEHSLSSVDYSNSAEALKRFKLYVDGAISAEEAEKSLVAACLYFITILGRSILMSIRLKNFRFLGIFFKTYLA